jgi:hypothetical protein
MTTNPARNLTLLLGATLLAAGCSGTAATNEEPRNTNAQLSAACQQAQDDCKAKFDDLQQKGEDLAKMCTDTIGTACKAGPSADCTKAQDDCKNGAMALQQDADAAKAACDSGVAANCNSSSMTPAGSPPAGNTPPSGPSADCLKAIDDCQSQTQMLTQAGSLANCEDAVTKACMDPNNIAGCQQAVADCTKDVGDLQSKIQDVVQQCVADITMACK